MKKILFAVLLLFISSSLQSQDWLNNCIVRSDNDYVSHRDTISPHENIKTQVKKQIKNYFDGVSEDDFKTMQEHNLVFKVAYSEIIDIYIVKAHFDALGINYYFFSYNKATNKHSDFPYKINGKWIENDEEGFNNKLCSSPLFSVTQDSLIILKERKHNGTSYDAVVAYYLSIDSNMNMKLQFCVESIYLYTSPEVDNSYTYKIIRTRDISTNRIDCKMLISNAHKQSEIFIGNFIISRQDKNITNRYCHSPHDDFLITGSGIDENSFTYGNW